jgi:hypothetical protein
MNDAWGHPKLCVCPACSTRRETELRRLVAELVKALDAWADAKSDGPTVELITRARGEGR